MACLPLVPEKIAFCLQRSGTKYRCFIWAKRSTAQRAVMVHSARSIALLLAPFDVALPSEREKPSFSVSNKLIRAGCSNLDWDCSAESTEQSQSRFLLPRVEFYLDGSQHACCIFKQAITQPIVLDNPWDHIDQLCIRALTSERAFAAATWSVMMRETARSQQQVPQHFDGARANGSLFAPPVDLISFTSYGAD